MHGHPYITRRLPRRSWEVPATLLSRTDWFPWTACAGKTKARNMFEKLCVGPQRGGKTPTMEESLLHRLALSS